MNPLNLKDVYKTFHRSQRECRVRSKGNSYIAYSSAMNLIGDAFTSFDKEQALNTLFKAQMAANHALAMKARPDFVQSEKLTIALTKFRGGVQ